MTKKIDIGDIVVWSQKARDFFSIHDFVHKHNFESSAMIVVGFFKEDKAIPGIIVYDGTSIRSLYLEDVVDARGAIFDG